jgi:hypothetical protein
MLRLRVTMDKHLQDVPIQGMDLLTENAAATILPVVPLPYRLGERPT